MHYHRGLGASQCGGQHAYESSNVPLRQTIIMDMDFSPS